MKKTTGSKLSKPLQKLPRLSIGSLRGLSQSDLDGLKAKLEGRWIRDNRLPGRPGRPNVRGEVFAACERIKPGMLIRGQNGNLHDWYRAVTEDLRAHAIELSAPTKRKFIREWMKTCLQLDASPEGLVPYLINARKDFREVQWVLLWGALCKRFPIVQRWLKDYQRQHSTLPGELPHEILPAAIQDKIQLHFDAPLGPRLYDLIVRKSLRSLRNLPEK